MPGDRAGAAAGSGVDEQPFVDPGPGGGMPEALVLDIGADIGALILYADEACLGREIDLTRAGSSRSHGVHTMIRRRRSGRGERIAGVYPELAEGAWVVWSIDGEPLAEVTVTGGRIAELDVGDCRASPGRGRGDAATGPS